MSITPITPVAEREIDLRVLLKAVARALPFLIVIAAIVGAGAYFLLSRIPPTYKSTVTLLIERAAPDPMRTDSSQPDTTQALDKEAITSQVQLILSRDLARVVVRKLDLAALP